MEERERKVREQREGVSREKTTLFGTRVESETYVSATRLGWERNSHRSVYPSFINVSDLSKGKDNLNMTHSAVRGMYSL